jgi:hypothetical protein
MNTTSTTLRAIGIAVLATLCVSNVANVGYAKMWKPWKIFSLDNTWPFRDKDEPHEGTPVRMVCTWSDTVMTTPGQKPQRGFGGRIMFYEKDEKNPIIVDGQLVVYAFDETDRDPTDNKPTRRYVFPSEQMPLHMSKSELGASYSVWLPWDEAGGPRTDISLICRFEPTGGAVVTSEQTRHRLPGSTPAITAKGGSKKPPIVPEGVPSRPAVETLQSLQAKRNEHGAQQASYEAPSADGEAIAGTSTNGVTAIPSRHMTSTTINLPNNFQMPNAATLNAAQQAPRPFESQSTPQPMPQASSATGQPTPAEIQAALQQIAANQAAAASAATPTTPSNALPPHSQSSIMPGPPAIPQSAGVFGATPMGQTPMMQQQSQQMALQQQLMQQQTQLRQSLQQQNMLPAQAPAVKATPAMGAATPLNSQAAPQYR